MDHQMFLLKIRHGLHGEFDSFVVKKTPHAWSSEHSHHFNLNGLCINVELHRFC